MSKDTAYRSVSFKEFRSDPAAFTRFDGISWIAKTGRRKRGYLRLFCGFDIETYTHPDTHNGYMYIWQFSIYGRENIIVYGRLWSEFVEFIKIIKDVLQLSSERRLLVWIFNMGFEFQFIKRWFTWSKIFAKEPRQPLYAFHEDRIEFRDAQAITGGSLAFLSKNYTKSKKKVGDLDYSVPRNFKTKLTDKELDYCLTDVAILSEFSEYIFNKYIDAERYVPLTKTGLLRRQVKQEIGKNFDIKREIYRCYPPTFELYSELMEWCFRGGYTHANLWHAGKKLEGLHARDITSSYPYVMLASDGFPVSPLKMENPKLFEKRLNGGKHCIMFRAIFINLKARTDHSYESRSKCMSISRNAIIDNGRVRFAGIVEVWLTEIDFNLYRLFYEWDDMKVEIMYTSIRGRLPRYLLMPLARAYEKKAKMKHDGLADTAEYSNYKSLVNSAFGMCCTRIVTSEVKMSQLNYEWYLDSSDFDYEKERKKAILLPQWGIYVCALARQRICEAIYSVGHDSVYTDTDSIKYLGDHEDYFEAVNRETEKTMKKVCKRYNLPFEFFSDLGTFEPEYGGREVNGKFLGAKRYIIEDQGEPKVTVAGLPKGTLEKYCTDNGLDIWDTFKDKMLMSLDVSGKNAHAYNDAPHQDFIDGELCAELSSVGIYPIDFTMKLNEFYLCLIAQVLNERSPYEKRIY